MELILLIFTFVLAAFLGFELIHGIAADIAHSDLGFFALLLHILGGETHLGYIHIEMGPIPLWLIKGKLFHHKMVWLRTQLSTYAGQVSSNIGEI